MAVRDPRVQERVGSVLHDKWTLERLIGEGGMGAVYAARHRNGAKAAVKILSPEGGRVPHIRKRFLSEGYAANRVNHPGAVKVLDDDVIQEDGPDQGTAYLVMELLEGESLRERATREPPLGERDLLEIAAEVLGVLDAAHANGVVHRDLKPDNLFLAKHPDREKEDGTAATQIKVLDFGLARLLEAREQTIAGMALGTPTYMSPEQASGHVHEIDGRTDLYALGSILFQLVSNRRIHDAGHTLGLVIRMATTPAPKLRTVAPDVSEPFARIVDRALEFQRDDRYLTAAFMRADVLAALAIMRTTEPTTLNVLGSETPPFAKADTVAVDSNKKSERTDNTTRAVENVSGGEETPAPAEDSTTAKADTDDSEIEPARRNNQRGLPMRAYLTFALLTIAALAAWRNTDALARMFTGATPTPTPTSTSTTTTATDPPFIAIPVEASTSSDLDASSTMMLLDEDAGDGGGDAGDEEDDDDDDDLDGAVSTDGSPSAAAVRQRRQTQGVHPWQKRKGTPNNKRPGTKRHKKRWHW